MIDEHAKLKADMRVCADHYQCTPSECVAMWRAALGDVEAAQETFDAVARRVRPVPEDFNDQIKESIAQEREAGFESEWRT